ncbi:Chaperone protein DnaJ [Rhynchospora pubera]|uniref:Chaperone protein DnaJ n=1 Tax=Rhynchospora pubera TaxID=906938 RepID=A0AAV8DZS6_9POAL|nr:Chaperone protein DnaJ [Rhynchospora pubera]
MEQDHYKTLGLNRSATKEEIKDAFRKSALKFHPDRHAQSSAATRNAASTQFKKASEAYETLIDERRRADYDFRWRNGSGSSNWRSSSSASSGNYYYYRREYTYRGGGGGGGGGTTREYYWSGTTGRSNGFDWRMMLRVITTYRFLVGVGFASILVGSALAIEDVAEGAWRRNNAGKSFDEAMEALENARVQKDKDAKD